MIELKTLDKTFQMIHASDHITATIPDGMAFGLIGSNGAGKSTLLRMISGILKPDEGEVLIDGESVFENPSVKSQICFLSDTPYFFPNADIQQMRNYYMLCYPSFNRKLFDSLTDRFNLDPKRKISSFSKGMKKQVSILLGLCSGTKYLLCDETFDGLDPVVRQAVKSLFAAEILNRDFTPIISSHNLRELEDFCDSIGLLHQGQLLLTQSLDQIKCSVCKLQCVISDPHKEQQFLSSIKILKMERSGSLLTLTLRGSHSDILSAVQTYDPVFAEVLPLTLEEIFYHGLALKRHQLFAISYLAGLFLFLIPYIVCTVLTILVGAVKGIMTLSLAGECFLTMGTGILAFLLIYHTCIFAGMLTGRSVTMFLGTLVIGVYPSLVLTLLPSLRDAFFQTTYNVHDSIPEKLSEYLSPFPLFIRMLEQNNSYSNVFMITAALVLIVLLLAASIMLYRIYPSESAGNALAFKFTPPVFKVLISIPTAVFISLLVKSFIGASGTKWIIILSMLAIVLLCGLIEFIYWQDLKMLLKGWRSSVIAIGFVAVLLAVFQFDFTGYDTYLPKEEKIARIGTLPDSFASYFWYPEDYTSEDDRESFVLSDDVDVLYNLAQSGIENVKKGITPNTLYSSQTSMQTDKDSDNYICAAFCFELESGKKVYRNYCVSYNETLEAFTKLCQKEDYRKELFPIFHVEKENVSSVSLQDIYITPEELLLTAEQRTELLSAYEKDVLNTDIRKLGSEVPIGEFSLTIRHVPNKETNTNQPFHSWVNGTREWNAAVNTAFPVTSSEDETNYKTFSIGSLYIYEDYENTLSCLEKYGYKIKRLIRAEDIDSVTLYLSGDSMKNKKWNDLLASFSSAKDENNSDPDKAAYEQSDEKDATSMFTITAPEDFRLLAEHLYLNPSDFLDRGGTSRDYAEVTFKKENNTFTYLLK